MTIHEEGGGGSDGRQKPRPEQTAVKKGAMWQFFVLLRELLQTVEEPPRRTNHKRLPLRDMLFILVTKVFFRLSSSDVCLFLDLFHPELWAGPIPHRNSVTNYMEMEWLRPILEGLVGTSSKPLIPLSGVLFAIDSTPILAPGYYLSRDRKTKKLFERRNWFRLHMICDDLTGVVTAARADSMHVAEQRYFEVLLGETMKSGFHVEAISADKNYCTKANVRWAKDRGVQTYITVKKNARRSKKNSDPAWDENYERAKSDDQEVRLKFHKRNRIESVNSALKSKYEEEVLSKSPAARYNEALCKVICHNLIVLIRCSRQLGFTLNFEKK
jgi:hypothetical protein